MHDGLVGLVLEVAVPAGSEFGARPGIHLRKFFLGWSDLDSSFDTVCGQGSGTVDVPLIKDLLLSDGISSNEVVEGLDVRLGAEGGEGQVMILEVQTYAGEVDQWLDSSLAELLRVAWVLSVSHLNRALESTYRFQNVAG